ncbi:MAG TPA: helix-turn-helix transcriptional regulator [Gemmataceae bacterium]|nr:helix-turn-helix transcriptional regulator [Gemmataceae bacterium]
MMDKETRGRLEAAGFRVGDAEDFLGLTDEERRLVELRLAASRAVRRRREERGVTQLELARKLKSSQSRVAKIEAGAADVSLDLLIRALFVAGGEVADLAAAARHPRKAHGVPRSHGAGKPKARAEKMAGKA